jgi:hypothetical protein
MIEVAEFLLFFVFEIRWFNSFAYLWSRKRLKVALLIKFQNETGLKIVFLICFKAKRDLKLYFYSIAKWNGA